MFLFWTIIVVALAIIALSFIMAPDSNSFSGALVGSTDLDLFKVSKERGSKKALKWSMYFLGFALLIGAIIYRAIV